MTGKSPEIIEVTSERMDELLERAASSPLVGDDLELMRQILSSYRDLFQMVGDNNTTIARLRKMMFGIKSEKAKSVLGDATDDGTADVTKTPSGDEANKGSDEDTDVEGNNSEDDQRTKRGHGRYAAVVYSGADQVNIKHPEHSPGDACPECGQGTLYEKTPGVLVRFVGQAPLQATVYQMQKLRCHLCGKLFTAAAPADIGNARYDHTVASMIGLLKYGTGLPFNRVQRLQGNCEIPLAASTQWDIVHGAAPLISPAFDELIRQAAQGEVLHNDDTTVRILELMGERFRKNPPVEDDADPDRTGLFTSGVVATNAGRRIALFFSGRQHAGENLSDVLKHRAAELEAPIRSLQSDLPQRQGREGRESLRGSPPRAAPETK